MIKFIKSAYKKIILLLLLLFIFIFFCAINYVNSVSSNISDNILRLHIIANSDSVSDQNLKYVVRDNILNYMNNCNINISSKDDLIKYIEENKDLFYDLAYDTIHKYGYDYDVSISIGKYDFPTKSYGDITLPAGTYDALRIEIGDAVGQNWWCVMFPPLCFIDATTGIVPDASKELLQNNLDIEEYNLISDTYETDIQVKFKIVEYFNNLFK